MRSQRHRCRDEPRGGSRTRCSLRHAFWRSLLSSISPTEHSTGRFPQCRSTRSRTNTLAVPLSLAVFWFFRSIKLPSLILKVVFLVSNSRSQPCCVGFGISSLRSKLLSRSFGLNLVEPRLMVCYGLVVLTVWSFCKLLICFIVCLFFNYLNNGC